MLLDLGRNDVGRAGPHRDRAPDQRNFVIERYSHVIAYRCPNVVGELAEGQDALSALLAGLPAGTVSGAPKVRAMQIIDELEPGKSAVSMAAARGIFSAGGEMDMCICLRTAVLKDETLYIQAGGGRGPMTATQRPNMRTTVNYKIRAPCAAPPKRRAALPRGNS